MPPTLTRLLYKLIDHETSARTIGSIAEAEAFAKKVQQIMLAHDLTMSDLGYEPPEWQELFKPQTAVCADTNSGSLDRSASWKEVFGNALAEQDQPLTP